jgi:nucleotide-binding universal stress UspA family protein
VARALQLAAPNPEESTMSHASVNPPRVVVVAAIDASPTAERVVGLASGLGQPMRGAELHLLHVVDAAPVDPAVTEASELIERGRSLLDKSIELARSRFAGKIVGHLAAGNTWREIVQFAANVHADLIVVGTHDRKGLSRLVLGSVAEQVMRKASCAVLVARPKAHDAEIPEIEPPCPDCVETQRASAGENLWCARHGEHHEKARLHYETPPSFGIGSMLIRP